MHFSLDLSRSLLEACNNLRWQALVGNDACDQLKKFNQVRPLPLHSRRLQEQERDQRDAQPCFIYLHVISLVAQGLPLHALPPPAVLAALSSLLSCPLSAALPVARCPCTAALHRGATVCAVQPSFP